MSIQGILVAIMTFSSDNRGWNTMGAPRVLSAGNVEVGSAMPKRRAHRGPRDLQSLLLCLTAILNKHCEYATEIFVEMGNATSTLHHI